MCYFYKILFSQWPKKIPLKTLLYMKNYFIAAILSVSKASGYKFEPD